MATLTEEHQPSFVLFAVNNNRTAWRSFGLATVLIVPHRRDAGGNPIDNSHVSNVRIAIEGAPTEALVGGHDHVGLRFPDRELFARTISTTELLDRQIELSLYSFQKSDGTIVEIEDAVRGDKLLYTTASGIRDTVTFLPDADYFDLSDILIETELLPPRRYNLIYSCDFFLRVTVDGIEGEELLCIDTSINGRAALRFGLNHPGEVMLEFFNATPQPYLTSSVKAEDSTIAFYRPFTDILQDIFDEQSLLEKANWVYNVPFEFIPHLAGLLGWEVPYFPESLDNLRRAIIRKTRELQQLKGSQRAVRELMSLFGFTVLINNLWYAIDGSRFIAPGERLPPQFSDQTIRFEEKCQVDLILSEYNTDGFGEQVLNLLFRPQRLFGIDPFLAPEDSGTLTFDAYLVESGSDADLALKVESDAIFADPDGYGQSTECTEDPIGFIHVKRIDNAVAGLDVVGHSTILIRDGLAVEQSLVGQSPPFKIVSPTSIGGIRFDKNTNQLKLAFSTYIAFGTQKVYAFAAYKRQAIIVPAELADLQSNRFDIQILRRNDNSVIRSDILDFIIDFIHRLKAFHSLLNVVRYNVDLDESYLVTDHCLGGDVSQRFDTDAGRQQVPPAIIPGIPGENCFSFSAEGLGYKETDLVYRKRVISGLLAEFVAWQALDGRTAENNELLRLMVVAANDASCQFNRLGQDRVTGERDQVRDFEIGPSPNAGQNSFASELNLELSPTDDVVSGIFPISGPEPNSNNDSSPFGNQLKEHDITQQTHCELDGQTDYCFKGRVSDELLIRPTLQFSEIEHCKPCGISLGVGVYWSSPVPSVRVIDGVHRPMSGSLTPRSTYSGGAKNIGEIGYLRELSQAVHLSLDYNKPLPAFSNSLLGRLLRGYDQPQTESLHFSNRPFLENLDQARFLAIQRPNLDVQLLFMHFPGARFPTMNKLQDDYISDIWGARPWDPPYSEDTPCCMGSPTWLNARLVIGTNGDEQLVFDSAPFTVFGNGLEPDISSLGGHVVPSFLDPEDIIHKIFSNLALGHPAIELENICPCIDPTGLLEIEAPCFNSASELASGGFIDFCDGYACESGFFIHSGTDLGRNGLFEELFEALGVPGVNFGQSGGTSPIELLFRLGSGIKVEFGIRLDCGCSLVSPGGSVTGLTGSGSSAGSSAGTGQVIGLPCQSNLFVDQDGNRDFSCDHLHILSALVADEEFGVCSYRLDGSIPSLMEIIQ